MREIYKDLYYYDSGIGWNRSSCQLRIARKADWHIVIATEVYTGVTITWGAEALATQIVEEFNLDPEKTLFIEHWPETGTGDMWDEEKWDIVEFTWQNQIFWQKKKYASDPKWRRIQPQQLLKLLTS